MEHNTLASIVLNNRPELFDSDFKANRERLQAELAGRTVCVIGAGGSIGRATAEVLLAQRPRRTLLVDISENNLAEVTRRLRNRFMGDAPDFEAWPLDFTGPSFTALLNREKPDVILNFAAFKHVRSEKDALTLAEMIRVNVLGNLRLLDWAKESSACRRVFVISTDKAVNPASCMGATKRLMEHLLFAAAAEPPAAEFLTSTRFANVLFSDGSLPASFLARLEQRQPLAGPSDIERYFITPNEAGRLCLLAACHPQSGALLVPRMRPEDMLGFKVVAERLLANRGLQPRHYGEDSEAAFGNLESDAEAGYWPCMFTPSSTSGEKTFEEFVEKDEAECDRQPYEDITCIMPETGKDWAGLRDQLASLASDLADPHWLAAAPKSSVTDALAALVPSMRHIETDRNLDQVV